MGMSSRPNSRTGGTPRPSDRLGEVRTPVAWQFRERKPSSNFRRLSSASTSSEGESSSETEFHPPGTKKGSKRGPLSFLGSSQPPYYRSGTLRSSRSMPGIPLGTTWDGRPCPVHGGPPHPHPLFPGPHFSPVSPFHPPPPPGGIPLRKAGSMFDLRGPSRGPSPSPSFYGVVRPPPLPPNTIYATLPPPPVDNRSHYGSLRSLRSNRSTKSAIVGTPLPPPVLGLPPPTHAMPHYPLPPMPPPYLLPPGAQPRPFVIPAGVEPLPIRNPNKAKMTPNALDKELHERKGRACCRGPMPFVWFVVILVSVGVILGIILGATLG